MKRFHIALAVGDLNSSIKDYSTRLEQQPTVVVSDKYAMWRTDTLNFSINQIPIEPANSATWVLRMKPHRDFPAITIPTVWNGNCSRHRHRIRKLLKFMANRRKSNINTVDIQL